MASLLPYLQSSEMNHLKFSLVPDGGEHREKTYPFALIDDSAPYSRIIEATIVTDAGILLKKVFLQVQKDHYTLSGDSFRTVSNLDIESAWQLSFATSEGRHQVLLSSQTDRQGQLVRQGSLYYCSEKNLFFHPPCPSCGLPMTLCTDDEWLRSSGLSSYSGSAKRYLYCGTCCGSGLQEAYLYERDHSDPLSVKDRWSLLDRFGMIDEELTAPGAFPCATCPELGACYGPHKLARSRVVPFSFYPFYLLVCEAPSLHAMEFLPLVAGAPLEVVEKRLDPQRDAARLACLRKLKPFAGEGASLFPRSADRYFLEVLFLKLSFLRGVMQNSLLLEGRQGRKIARERIWVRLAPAGGSLPLLWSASVEMISDVNPHPSQLTLSTYSSDDIAHLGLAWFHALVLNQQVTAAALLGAVVEYISAERGESLPTESAGTLHRLAAPENLFWNPQVRSLPAEWLPLWQRTCAIGFQFLQAAAQPGTELSGPQVADALQRLLADIKSTMFSTPARQSVPVQQSDPLPAATPSRESVQPGPSPRDPAGAGASVDALLLGVVAQQVRKCRAKLQSPPVTPPGEIDDDDVATVIISPRGMAGTRRTREYNEGGTGTVVLVAPRTAGPAPQADRYRPDEPGVDAGMTETVVLSARQPVRPARQPARQWSDEEVTETVVLHAAWPAQGRSSEPVRAAAAPGARPPAADEGDELGETVVITPHRDKPRRF